MWREGATFDHQLDRLDPLLERARPLEHRPCRAGAGVDLAGLDRRPQQAARVVVAALGELLEVHASSLGTGEKGEQRAEHVLVFEVVRERGQLLGELGRSRAIALERTHHDHAQLGVEARISAQPVPMLLPDAQRRVDVPALERARKVETGQLLSKLASGGVLTLG